MKKLLFVTVILVAQYSGAASLSYHRIQEASYAIHTRFTIGGVERMNREAYLYRLEYLGAQGDDDLEVDAYRLKKLDMISDATKYSYGEIVGYFSGGQLPFLLALWRQGGLEAVLSPEAFFKKPLLFPVLDGVPGEIEPGVQWEAEIPPVILEDDVATQVIAGTIAISNMSPTVVKNRVVAHETLNGRACVQISSTVSVQSEHGATAEYKIKSYFDITNGIPVMNIVEGSGIVLGHKNAKNTFMFYRKEILVSVEYLAE